jgi:hypothetical protein
MDGFFWFIIIIAIISSIISAAAKKKKRDEAARRAAQEEPEPQAPRSAPMSDVRRAFMMAQAAPPQAPYTPPRPAYPPAQAQYVPPRAAYPPPQAPQAPPQPAYTPAHATVYTPMEPRMAAPMEARTVAPMQARTSAAAEERSASALPPRPAYTDVQSRSAGGHPVNPCADSMENIAAEGCGDGEDDGPVLETVRVTNLETVSDADLETVTERVSPARPVKAVAEKSSPGKLPLRLFKDKNELIKAVIYAEILAPRSQSGRRA